MGRPMTAADREPQERDVLSRGARPWFVRWFVRFDNPEFDIIGLARNGGNIACERRPDWGKLWYIRRKDGGPVEVEEG